MTTRTRRAVGVGLGSAAIAIGAMTGAPPAGAQGCSPSFIGGSSYLSRLCGMPDYDQRRTAGLLQGDGRTYNENTMSGFNLALPGNGGCHCVPTSFTNLLGYYVGKGVQGSFPRKFNWDSRPGYVPRPSVPANTYLNGQAFPGAEVVAYNSATIAIKTLGLAVKTGDAGCGTSWGTVLNYFSLFRNLYPKVYMGITTSTPAYSGPKQVANILAAGGTVSIAYGRYENYSETNGIASWGDRKGGHAVTIREVSGSGNNAQFKISDPASNADPAEGGDNDRFRQSATEAKQINLTRVFNPGKLQFRWRYGNINASGNTAIWDSMLVAYPVSAVMTNGGSVQFFPGWAFNRTGTAAAHAAQDDAVPTELKPKSFSLGTRTSPVLDAAFLPATGEIAYIRKGDGSVRAIGVGTREKRVIGDAPKGATQLEPDPTGGRIYVGGSEQIFELDPTAENDEGTKKMKAPAAVQALSFDPGKGLGNGRLVAITADRNLHKLQPGTLAVQGSPQVLPRALFEGTGPISASVSSSGQLYLRRGASEKVARIGLPTRQVGRRTIDRLQGTGGLAVGERGSVFTIIDGKIAELSPTGSPVTNSPLSGRSASGRVLQVTRSGSDIPAGMADQVIDERVVDPNFPEMAP